MRSTRICLNRVFAPAAAWVVLTLVPAPMQAQSVPPQETHGITIADMDRSVTPGDDFYDYTNGAWIKRTVIPPDRGSVGHFNSLADLSNKRTAALLEDAEKANASAGSSTRKIGDLYGSYMNEASIEPKGLAPLGPHLEVTSGSWPMPWARVFVPTWTR
jgi:putative endopeptidase